MTRNLRQAERAFVGCLLRNPQEVMQVAVVTPPMLSEPHLQAVHKATLDLTEAGRPVTLTTLLSVLPDEFEGQGPTAGIIAALKANAEDAGSAADYAEAIIEREAVRRIAEINEWVAQESKRGERDADIIAAEAARKLQQVMEITSPVQRERLGAAAARAAERSTKASNDHRAVPGIPTGIPALDAIVGRLYGLSFLIASQGEGKSALAAQIAIHAAESGRPALIFQFEMDAEEMGAREVSARTGLSVESITEPQGDAFNLAEIMQAARDLSAIPVEVISTEGMTVRQIGAQCKAMERTTGLSLVVIDQLDKVKAEGKHKDRFERLAEITLDLKNLSKSMPNVTFLVLGQRTRGAQRRDDPTPEINDADAPSIERDADVIVGLWFPANWMRRQKPKRNVSEEADKWEAEMRRLEGKAEAITLKHRRRKAFQQCELRFDGGRMRFGDAQ
ncbi:DnaB-like helicase C-terminal domain-containing protein [Pseudorhodoplanes sp.]|uniref:DnaB-like helicase C-terminal domain-containing protein n=1 Tax=Pseudorhodoplanes sp. TaxID=1934341 RepID=UPI002C393871|nr:DnaB-like helicase C-terminal domain-containing protein [Pseudorhodoplanes sp.]HWV44100.1 DnaB-like helicase C-terminal domain-containing protein [Pseudorhodoplanes sp.]